jgi:hypothetical protein
MERITLLTTGNRAEAEELRNRLASHGLTATLRDETWLQRLFFLSEPEAAEHVIVDRKDYEEALQVLRETMSEGEGLKGAIWCPQCGSAEIEYPQFNRKFVTPALAEVLMTLRVFPKEFYCTQCHYTWTKVPEGKEPRDLLGWRMDSKLFHPENATKQSAVDSGQ